MCLEEKGVFQRMTVDGVSSKKKQTRRQSLATTPYHTIHNKYNTMGFTTSSPSRSPVSPVSGSPRSHRQSGSATRVLVFHRTLLLVLAVLMIALVWMQAFQVHVDVSIQLVLDEKIKEINSKEDKKNFKPIQCHVFKQQTNIPDPNQSKDSNQPKLRNFHARANMTKADEFWVSLLDPKIDVVRWDIMTYGRYYERQLEDLWADLIYLDVAKNRPLYVLDVGANVGYYSIYSAALAKQKKAPIVINAMEPNTINLLRACESIQLNHWLDHVNESGDGTTTPRIQLWQYGLSDQDGTLNFRYGGSNPGAGKVVTKKDGFAPVGYEDIHIPVWTLDQFATQQGWLDPVSGKATPTAPRMTIMKIDVERHEAQVLLGGPNFIKAHMARNIMTEVGGEEETDDMEAQTVALQMLVDAGYILCGLGNYRGPGNMPLDGMDNTNAQGLLITHLMARVNGGRNPYLNVWWQAPGDNCARK